MSERQNMNATNSDEPKKRGRKANLAFSGFELTDTGISAITANGNQEQLPVMEAQNEQ